MNVEAFASRRRAIFADADEVMKPIVRAALERFGQAGAWDAVIDQATNLWLSILTDEAPNAFPDRIVRDFRSDLGDSLAKTAQPSDPVKDSEVERVAMWISTYAVNSATWYAGRAEGDRTKRWITMHDGLVRPMHHLVDGQVRLIGGTFDVGGHKLRFPGEPIGPPEVWINCRCIMQPGGARAVTAAATSEIDEELDITVADDDFPEDELEEVSEEEINDEELVDDLIEIPVHGVLAPEGVPTGDGRMFAAGSLTSRELPLPIRDETVGTHGGDTSEVVTVGRIDEIFRSGNEMRFRGVVIMSKEHAPEVVEGIIDGTKRGISVEVDDVVIDVSETKEQMRERLRAERSGQAEGEMQTDEQIEAFIDEMIGDGTTPLTTFAHARIAGFTIVPIPAYPEAYIALGWEFEDEDQTVELTDEERDALTACGCLEGVELEEIREDDYRKVSTDERKKLADEGNALPDGSFPIANVDDLKNAIQAIGRAKDPKAARAHIKKRARELGAEELIPDNWSAEVYGYDLSLLDADALAQYEAMEDDWEAQRIWMLDQHPDAVIASAAFAPGTKDGPGWITHPRATARIRRYWVRGKGAAKIKWGVPGDFNRCRRQLAKYVRRPDWLAGLCANMHKEAIGVWPGMEGPGGRHAANASTAPAVTLVAAGAKSKAYPSEWFDAPKLDSAIGMRIEGERIYGYLAEWGTCHIGVPGVCTTAPRSSDNYATFLKGVVDTDKGEQRVGCLTYGIGHADLRMRAAAATAHYDKTEAVRAFVNMGEDERGIWYAGVLAPWVTEADKNALRAIGGFSGDWRDVRNNGNLELVAAVCVNTRGFTVGPSLAASGGHQTALILDALPREDVLVAGGGMLDADTVAAISRTAVAEFIHETKRQEALEATRERRAKIKSERLAALRAKVTKEK